MKVNTDWKSLLFFIFYGPEKTIRLAKNKITKIEEKLNETIKHCPIYRGFLISV